MSAKKASFTVKLILFPLFIIPRPFKKLKSYLLTLFWFYVLRLRVNETVARVKMVFPEKSDKEVKKIAFDSFYNLILVLFEYSYLPFSKNKIYKYTEVEGYEFLDEALKGDRPVFIFAGHLANGEILLSRMCYDNKKVRLIAKRVGNGFIDKALFEIREICGLKHIPPKNALKDISETVKDKAPIIFLHDQYKGPPKGVETTFLGVPTYTNPSVALFASKYDAVVIPAVMFRKNSKSVLKLEAPIPFEKKFATNTENCAHMTQVYNDWLSEKIKQRPGDWMWIHRRWKNLRNKKK